MLLPTSLLREGIFLAMCMHAQSCPTLCEPMDGSPVRVVELLCPWNFPGNYTLVAQRLKRLPPMRETRDRCLGREDPLEKELAIHSSILAWRIPWTQEHDGL